MPRISPLKIWHGLERRFIIWWHSWCFSSLTPIIDWLHFYEIAISLVLSCLINPFFVFEKAYIWQTHKLTCLGFIWGRWGAQGQFTWKWIHGQCRCSAHVVGGQLLRYLIGWWVRLCFIDSSCSDVQFQPKKVELRCLIQRKAVCILRSYSMVWRHIFIDVLVVLDADRFRCSKVSQKLSIPIRNLEESSHWQVPFAAWILPSHHKVHFSKYPTATKGPCSHMHTVPPPKSPQGPPNSSGHCFTNLVGGMHVNPFCYPPPPQVERMLPFWSDNIAPCVRDPVWGNMILGRRLPMWPSDRG